ncbi:hypothetical protein [Actinacidiphila sp. ITFR-21]|uniref:hypothetical protein n=1 Tax=Actinacidiphila sp. ITFR-21 TaxID=3075199 RepID=UPI0028890030|nr:hypothetical protein [Streptomyces sp. ITFR-21]WNI20344.1 hypothetical protein RLT57_32595 [Streptomyces sp. ITFR-21]
MTAPRRLLIAAYISAYGVAVYAGATAVEAGDALYATGLFGTSAGLLLGVRREYAAAAAIRRTTALPPGCLCEMWWITLGVHHDAQCPALTSEESR